MRRLYLLALALLATGLIAAGCGDDDDDGGDGDDSPPAAQTQEQDQDQDQDTGGSEDAETGDLPASADAATEQAVEACKQSIDAQPQLSDDVKGDLEEICEEAASGDEDAVRQATKDVCVKIVEETAPAGPARDAALDACDQATQTP